MPLSALRVLSLGLAVLGVFVLASWPALAAAQRPRVIVLSFEGWHADEARTAVVRGLETRFELVDEQAAIDAAAEIGVDVSTPDGMATVVVHLGIELVVGGSVSGRARSARTSIWVSDVQGNELAVAEGPSPSGRANATALGEAAAGACAQAYESLHPPEPPPPEVVEGPPLFDPDDDLEPERDRPTPDDPNRWRLPVFRGLVGLDVRNRTASIAPNSSSSRFDADFFPAIAVQLESHPLSGMSGPENGLYLSLDLAFSAGITYTNAIDFQPYPLNTYYAEGNVGYGGIIGNTVELGGTLGFGVDGVGLGQIPTRPPVPRNDLEFPSVEYLYARVGVYTRIRLYRDLVQLEGGVGGRILISPGEIGSNQGIWDDGYANGGGFDFDLGLGGVIDPGFTYAARFGFAGHYLSFFDGARMSESATDEAFHIHLLIGWAISP
jgi:hypothetical protein